MKWWGIFLVLFLIFVLSLVLWAQDPLEEEIALQTQKLEELKKEQARLEEELKRILSSEKDLTGELAKIEQQIASLEKDIAQSREKILTLEQQRKNLQKEVEQLSWVISREQESREKILKRAYMAGGGDECFEGLLFGVPRSEKESGDFLAAECLRFESARIREALEKEGSLRGKLKEIEQRIRLEVVLKEKLLVESKRLAELRKAREEMLRRLSQDKTRFEKNRQELARAQRGLESTIARLREELQKKRVPSPSFQPVKRGRFFWPVQGGTVFREFGERKDPRYGITFYNPGVDIACPVGTPVFAAGDGVVILASTIRGYGKTIIIDHGNDVVTVYAHLGEIRVEPGEEVRGGQTIALSGDSGLADRPMIHFEVRVGTSAREENPLLWLR